VVTVTVVASFATIRRRVSLRRASVALARVFVAAVVVCGLLQSGARFFYCEGHGLSLTDPCVQPSAHPRADCQTTSLEQRPIDCCEVIQLPSLPRATQLADAAVEPSPWVAVLPVDRPSPLMDGPDETPSRRTLQRWRAPPRTSDRVHAHVMVFLT
jgi:hypothetical protein